jgi:DNA-binding response OmpR family regulator
MKPLCHIIRVSELKMPPKILSVSYDLSLLATRKMLLEHKGYSVTNGLGFTQSIEQCSNGGFDLFILGHSIPKSDKLALIASFRANCPAPILSLERHGEDVVACDYHASPDDPKHFVEVVEKILAGRENGMKPKLP